MQVRENVASYIQNLINETIGDHSLNLFEQGMLNSLHVLDLIAFIENSYSVSLTDDDIDMESFGTINSIVSLIEIKLK